MSEDKTTPEESEMKVPIETDEVETPEAALDQEAQQEAAADADQAEKTPEEIEAEMVEAAKRAGEAAANAEIAADAKKLEEECVELRHQLEEAQDQVETAKKSAATSAERLVRLQADWENYRRRTAQERNAERDRAAEKLVVNLLPVLDDMERAIDHARGAAADDGKDDQFDQFVAGVEAVHDKMVSILGKEGVEVINPLDEAFDPLEHQAVGRVENTEAYDETVAAVYQRGYRLGSKVIREAMVQVTFGGPKRPAPEGEGAEEPQAAPDASGSESE